MYLVGLYGPTKERGFLFRVLDWRSMLLMSINTGLLSIKTNIALFLQFGLAAHSLEPCDTVAYVGTTSPKVLDTSLGTGAKTWLIGSCAGS